jgi:NADPH:quinone reductase-like Zn-dependent oxidoreductase
MVVELCEVEERNVKAIVRERYGPPDDVLELKDIDRPAVGEDEVLIHVHASSVNVADWIFLTGKPRPVRLVSGMFRPKHRVLGRDVAGRVEAVGKNITRFRPGDEVFGEIDFGAYAEYACSREDLIARKPSNLTFEQAAAVPLAGLTALQGLRDTGRIQAGHHVLINGASGAVGTFAVQVAKSFGAEVTGVCRTRNVDMVRSIGADHVVDYTREDFTAGDRRYDLILDLVASRPLSACRRILSPDGMYVSSAGKLSWVLKVFLTSIVVKQVRMMPVAGPNPDDLAALTELLESGKMTPEIDRTYPLSEVGEALRRQGEGHARGKTVISVV